MPEFYPGPPSGVPVHHLEPAGSRRRRAARGPGLPAEAGDAGGCGARRRSGARARPADGEPLEVFGLEEGLRILLLAGREALPAEAGREPRRSIASVSDSIPQPVWWMTIHSRVPSSLHEITSERIASLLARPPALRRICASPSRRPAMPRVQARVHAGQDAEPAHGRRRELALLAEVRRVVGVRRQNGVQDLAHREADLTRCGARRWGRPRAPAAKDSPDHASLGRRDASRTPAIASRSRSQRVRSCVSFLRPAVVRR